MEEEQGFDKLSPNGVWIGVASHSASEPGSTWGAAAWRGTFGGFSNRAVAEPADHAPF